MVIETVIFGASLVGCFGCWTSVLRHKLTMELEKHKLNNEALKPPVEVPPKPAPAQQSLTALLSRRKDLEEHINILRTRASDQRYNDKNFSQYRADSLKALEDARKEQQELVVEEKNLIELMYGVKNDRLVPAEKPVRFDPGRLVAEPLDGVSLVCDVELHNAEAGREGTA